MMQEGNYECKVMNYELNSKKAQRLSVVCGTAHCQLTAVAAVLMPFPPEAGKLRGGKGVSAERIETVRTRYVAWGCDVGARATATALVPAVRLGYTGVRSRHVPPRSGHADRKTMNGEHRRCWAAPTEGC